MRILQGLGLWVMALTLGFVAYAGARAPTPPKGLQPCENPFELATAPDWPIGEKIRYSLWLDGLAVGSVEFRVANVGPTSGAEAYEFVSRFKVDELVATVLPVNGTAHSVVEQLSLVPLRMWNDYFLNGKKYHESFVQESRGKLKAVREREGSAKLKTERTFPGPVVDFVSGFYLLRAARMRAPACALVFGSHRAFTVALEPQGTETVETPIGQRPADKIRLRYGAERSKRTREALVWLSKSDDRLPYRVEIKGEHHIMVKIDMYDPGQISILP